MSASTMRRRRASGRMWTFPEIYSYFERVEDGKLFQVRQIFRRDMQVRLESADGERHHPFLSMLETDYRPVFIGGER